MKKFISFVIPFFFAAFLSAQNDSKKLNQSNWQQHVSYKINVKLDDVKNILVGNISMVYTNNSPQELKEIYMHLWPNAYSNRNTAFAKQHLENGKTDFYFAKPQDQGSIDSLNFMVNDANVNWKLTNEIDVALLALNQPLLPNQIITISTPFYVFLPKVFSRMGHEKQLYCITQWFPKPAVYDVNGWNPIPYLDQGEFYSEFGSFDVNITVPKNYVVAATGNLQNADEKLFLNNLANETRSFDEIPLSSNEFKTLRFLQDSVHDFAWFASKEFSVKKGEVTLKNGKTVETWLFAKNVNNKGIGYINEGVKYYSDHIGNYPYNLAQVVITPLEAGGGMEYPTITNCGSIDRTTIIHEVGHNWFYGILGSNEREYPWMDESLNTYYESRCTQEKIDADIAKNGKKKDMMKDLFNLDISGFGQARLLYAISARKNEDQAGNLPSTTYTDFNYGAIIYAKNPLSFYMLQNYLGNEKFDEMMHAYYEKWKFKHPLPNDFRNHTESFTGKDLSWFFDKVLGSTEKMNYKITKVKNNEITVKNKSGLAVPFSLTSLNYYDYPIKSKQYDGFTGTKTFDLNPLLAKDSIMQNLVIDQNSSSIGTYKNNANWKTNYAIRFLPALENPNKRQIFCIPLYAWNNYNKSMLGLFINNDFFPQQKTEFNFTPLYSFTTNDLNGYLKITQNIFPKHNGAYKKVTFGLSMTRFAKVGLFDNDGLAKLSYEKFAPFVELHFKQKSERSLFSNVLKMRHVTVLENPQNSGCFNNWDNQSFSAFDITHHFKHDLKTYPSSANLNIQVGTFNYNFGRVAADFTQGVLYNDKGKTATLRLFAGAFFTSKGNSSNYNDYNISRSYFQAGGTTGQFDYLYDEAMFGRSEQNQQETWMARQVINRDAGFRNFVNIGSSSTWLTSANLTLPFPFKLPIGVYSDVVCWEKLSFDNTTGANVYETALTYSGGVYISLAKNIFQLYLPLFASKDVMDAWDASKLEHPFERASFILNLNALNPIKIVKESKL